MVIIEIIGSRYCQACNEMKRRLDANDVSYKFYDSFRKDPRYADLVEIAHDEGYTGHPAVIVNGECIGEGLSMIDKIYSLIEEDV